MNVAVFPATATRFHWPVDDWKLATTAAASRPELPESPSIRPSLRLNLDLRVEGETLLKARVESHKTWHFTDFNLRENPAGIES